MQPSQRRSWKPPQADRRVQLDRGSRRHRRSSTAWGIPMPAVEEGVNPAPIGEVRGHRPPGDPAREQVADRVQHLPVAVALGLSAPTIAGHAVELKRTGSGACNNDNRASGNRSEQSRTPELPGGPASMHRPPEVHSTKTLFDPHVPRSVLFLLVIELEPHRFHVHNLPWRAALNRQCRPRPVKAPVAAVRLTRVTPCRAPRRRRRAGT